MSTGERRKKCYSDSVDLPLNILDIIKLIIMVNKLIKMSKMRLSLYKSCIFFSNAVHLSSLFNLVLSLF